MSCSDCGRSGESLPPWTSLLFVLFPSFCKLLMTLRSMCVVQPVASVDVVCFIIHCMPAAGPPKQPTPLSVPLSSSSVGVDVASHSQLTCPRGGATAPGLLRG